MRILCSDVVTSARHRHPAGGPLYFLNAYLNFRLLREKGCVLPFEWFYLGAEMTRPQLREAGKIPNLRLVNLGGKNKDNTKDKGGWQSKIEAIVQSRFDEILFLDADSFPRRDPEYLFHEPLYVKHGAVFWPDIWKWSADSNPHLARPQARPCWTPSSASPCRNSKSKAGR